ncbi:hypothetical protein [Streptomyces sp. NPDC050704]|uniref:hypothetical protein n=1 Tax=Streptomyces sp. NPDC050704 TaxID=3157219 RepID=UPI0034298E2F
MRSIVAVLAVLGLALTGCGTENGDDDQAKPPASRPAKPTASRPASPTTEAAGPSWVYDEIFDEGSLSDVIAATADDIWVAGVGMDRTNPLPDDGLNPSPGDSSNPSPDDGFLLHHDGTRWQRQPMPGALGRSVYEARLDSLDSGEFLLTVTPKDMSVPRMARWDGARWTVLPAVPGDGRLADVKAFGPDDIWALVGESRIQHWDGTRWTTSPLPATATSLDGVAPDDLWAVGYRNTSDGSDGEELTQPAAVHWNGSSWKLTETPAYRFPEPVPAEPGASIARVLAFAADDVRAYGTHSFNHGEGGEEPQEESVRLRWDGSRWSRVADAEGECAGRVPVARDGAGGFFLDGNRYVTGDGACTKIKRPRLPSEGGITAASRQSLWLSAVEPVPGTDKVLGVGHVQVNQSGDPTSRSVIVSLRR